MTGNVRVTGMYNKVVYGVGIDTTSKSGQWAGLSPFNLGPCQLYGGFEALNMENAWQFAKVYASQVDANGDPTDDYWTWAQQGWRDAKPHRYPMGKGAKPLYSLWGTEKLGYIEARRRIYAPLYIVAVQQTQSFQDLLSLINGGENVTLRDYDGYDHQDKGMSLTDVLNDPKRKMGHAFVLKALLTHDPVLQEFK